MSGEKRKNEQPKGEKMSRKGEKMSGGFLPLYVVKGGKISHKSMNNAFWCGGG